MTSVIFQIGHLTPPKNTEVVLPLPWLQTWNIARVRSWKIGKWSSGSQFQIWNQAWFQKKIRGAHEIFDIVRATCLQLIQTILPAYALHPSISVIPSRSRPTNWNISFHVHHKFSRSCVCVKEEEINTVNIYQVFVVPPYSTTRCIMWIKTKNSLSLSLIHNQ